MLKQKIVFDCERMKYPNTGLYHYCLQLGRALTRLMDREKEELYFYLDKKVNGFFGVNDVSYIDQKSIHKFFIPKIKKANIWHCTYQGSNYFPIRKNLKTVLTIHDLNFLHDTAKSDKKKAKYLKKVEIKIKEASHIVCISKFVLEELKQHINLKNKPVSVIYNGCNINENDAFGITKPMMGPSQKFLFTIGTIVDKKNFHVLPTLLVNNNYTLVISGIVQNEEYKQVIINEAQKHNVADRVVFTGGITENDKNWYYKNCEAFVFPSVAEGFGLPVVEAMHYGKPIFLSTKTSLPEIGGENAYYFKSFDSESMRQTLAAGLINYHSDSSIKIKIKERASLFNWEKAAKEYLEIYRSLY